MSRIHMVVLILFAFSNVSSFAQEEQEAPAVLPSASSFSFRIVGSQLQVVQVVSKDESQFWLEPLSFYFLNKESRKNVELTNEQIEVIEGIEKDYGDVPFVVETESRSHF